MTELLSTNWDVVVIGAGMGGAVSGYELAKAGKKVLFLEKGIKPSNAISDTSIGPNLLENPIDRIHSGQWPDKVFRAASGKNADSFFLPLGCGPGGSTKLYASQLERFYPVDFEPPLMSMNNEGGNFLVDGWPIKYYDFVEFYRKAEKLFSVSGTQDPLNFDQEILLQQPPKIGVRDEKIFQALKERGLHPYRAHLACSFVEGCDGCGGKICPKKCKNDAQKIALEPALRLRNVGILYDCLVDKLNYQNGAILSLNCTIKGSSYKIKAKKFILSAGALNSPLILFRSNDNFPNDALANSSGMVGRNLMWHASDFFAIKPLWGNNFPTFARKAFSINDYYVHKGLKLGTIQSAGVPVDFNYVYSYLFNRIQKFPKPYSKIFPKIFLKFSADMAVRYFKNSSVFATIVEDFPYFDNRIIYDKNDPYKIMFNYNYTKDLRIRSEELYKNIKSIMGAEFRIIKLSRGVNINYGHACGTLRFGSDPKTSVLNYFNRAHDVSNLYILDSSFFPTSGGTNPSLTVAANALRVAEYLNNLP